MERRNRYAVFMFFIMMILLFSIAILLVTMGGRISDGLFGDDWIRLGGLIIAFYPMIILPIIAIFIRVIQSELNSEKN